MQPIAADVANTLVAAVLSTRRLTRLDPVSHAAMQVTAGAGVTIETLQQHARDAGLDFAVDWGARASATVGGAVSTNAGGSRVVRFGTMRAQVLGVQAVLADGSVITQLGGLPKETAGPPLSAGQEYVAIVPPVSSTNGSRTRGVPLPVRPGLSMLMPSSVKNSFHRLSGDCSRPFRSPRCRLR